MTLTEYRIAYETTDGHLVSHGWCDDDLEHLQGVVAALLRNRYCADAWVERRLVTTSSTAWGRLDQPEPLPKAASLFRTSGQEQAGPYPLDMTHLPNDRVVVAVDDLAALLRERAVLWARYPAVAGELRQIADAVDVAAINYASTRPEHGAVA